MAEVEGAVTEPNITEATIAAVDHLLRLACAQPERAQLPDNLVGQIDLALACRTVPLANSVPMAMRFDPRLPGFAVPHGASSLHFSPMSAACPSDEDFAFAPAPHLSVWIAKGALTSRRLTQICLDPIASLNPKLDCIATVTPDLALAEADAVDCPLRAGVDLGPLHGMPFGLKDLFDTKGIVMG